MLHPETRPPIFQISPPTMATVLESLERSVAAVTIDIVAAEAGKAALEARISTLKHERRRLEAELARELATAAAGKTPQRIVQRELLEEPASLASASDPVPHHGSGALAEPRAWGAGHAAASAADAPVTASRKRKRKGSASPPPPPPRATAAPEVWEAAATANTASRSGSASGGDGHGCSFCEERFPTPSTLAIHERAHAVEKPYACSMCPKRFAQKSHVVPHERSHTGEKPYACSVCPVRFPTSSAEGRHVRMQHAI